MNIELIDKLPGFVSVIDLDLRYMAVNDKLAQLMELDKASFVGKKAGEKCPQQSQTIERLIASPVGTEINWEYFYNNICLAVSSRRNEDYIFNQAVDITNQKQLEVELKASEERNKVLLKTLPDKFNNSQDKITENEELNQSNTKLSSHQDREILSQLISTLTNKPIVNQNNSESLIRLEVELRENSTRLAKIENLLFLDESSLTSRVKELEIHQQNDNSNWTDFEEDQENIKNLSRMASLICNIPGGLKTWLVLLIMFQMVCTFWIDIGIRYLNFKQLLPLELIQKENN